MSFPVNGHEAPHKKNILFKKIILPELKKSF
jgi:hypothetical protein